MDLVGRFHCLDREEGKCQLSAQVPAISLGTRKITQQDAQGVGGEVWSAMCVACVCPKLHVHFVAYPR